MKGFQLALEIAGAFTGLVYLYFSVKQNIWLWMWGILTSGIYALVFYHSKFYAGMVLQVYYLAVSVYGWYYWNKGKSTGKDSGLPVSVATFREWLIFLFVSLLLSLISGFLLDRFTDSPLPYWDAFTASGSMVATWMLARKYLENWIFWIAIDAVSVGLYLYKELFATSGLFAVYFLMAISGYFSWRRKLVKVKLN